MGDNHQKRKSFQHHVFYKDWILYRKIPHEEISYVVSQSLNYRKNLLPLYFDIKNLNMDIYKFLS